MQGLMSHDRVLAGALWRAFFESRTADPILLEQMVHYVRKQVLYHTEINSLLSFDVRDFYFMMMVYSMTVLHDVNF